jgi:thiol:disulfide interchange protein DsbA
MRRTLTKFLGWLAVAAVATIATAATAAPGPAPQLDRDYTLLNPPQQSQAPAGKVEVVEFFSYGCPHCKELQPTLAQWATKLPADVNFRRVPISFGRPAWARLARMYYTLDIMGQVEKYDGLVFKALHEEHANFNTDESIAAWAGSKGLDAKKFADDMASFSVQSMVPRGDQEANAKKIDGVPAIVVDGRYKVVNDGNFPRMLAITDALVDMVRKEKRK